MPEVTIENYENVYDAYLNYEQPRLRALAYYAFLSAKYRPVIHYASGAKEEVEELLAQDRPLMIALNHPTNTHDQFIAAGVAFRTPLRPLIGRQLRVLGKSELFKGEHRKRIDVLGGIPVDRGKDYDDTEHYDPKVYRPLLMGSGKRLVSTAAELMNRGSSIAIFPEGTHNVTDQTRMQKLNTGMAYIAHEAAKLGAEPALLHVGLSYGPDLVPEKFDHASVYVDNPVTELDTKPFLTTKVIQERMQWSLDEAHRLYIPS